MRLIPSLILAAASAATTSAWADGAGLYVEHCATCHGKDGGGDGPLAADLQFRPRAFKEGKFAFGDTPDALARTVRSGIPGQEKMRMPAFREVLSEAEVGEVVAYVRTLFPSLPAAAPEDLRLGVRDAAKIVRGILPGLREGDPPRARGMLVGLPSGFTFEYALDDFRLVAVRRGAFVDRSDWQGRGGQPLTPLGTPILTLAEPARWSPFAFGTTLEVGKLPPMTFEPAVAKLRSTTTSGKGAELRYDLVDRAGKVRAQVVERPRGAVVHGEAGIVQELDLRATGGVVVRFSIAFATPDGGTKGSGGAGGWSLIGCDGGPVFYVRSDLPEGSTSAWTIGDSLGSVEADVLVGTDPVTIRRTVVPLKDPTPERLRRLTGEDR